MTYALRVEILKNLPKGSIVTLISMRRKDETGIKISDSNTCMIVLLDDGKMPIRYERLTCEEIIKHEEVLKRLMPEPISSIELGRFELKQRQSGKSIKAAGSTGFLLGDDRACDPGNPVKY